MSAQTLITNVPKEHASVSSFEAARREVWFEEWISQPHDDVECGYVEGSDNGHYWLTLCDQVPADRVLTSHGLLTMAGYRQLLRERSEQAEQAEQAALVAEIQAKQAEQAENKLWERAAAVEGEVWGHVGAGKSWLCAYLAGQEDEHYRRCHEWAQDTELMRVITDSKAGTLANMIRQRAFTWEQRQRDRANQGLGQQAVREYFG